MRQAARDEVDRVAAALARGEPLTRPDAITFGASEVLVVVQDQAGEVVETVPTGRFASRPHDIPGVLDLAGVGTRLRDDVEHLADEAHDRRADDVIDTQVTHVGGHFVVASRSVDSPDGPRTVVAISALAEVARSVMR